MHCDRRPLSVCGSASIDYQGSSGQRGVGWWRDHTDTKGPSIPNNPSNPLSPQIRASLAPLPTSPTIPLNLRLGVINQRFTGNRFVFSGCCFPPPLFFYALPSPHNPAKMPKHRHPTHPRT